MVSKLMYLLQMLFGLVDLALLWVVSGEHIVNIVNILDLIDTQNAEA